MDTACFKEELKNRVAEIENVISSYLPAEEGMASKVFEAMNYSVLAGGKRLRPMLVLETYKMFSGDNFPIIPEAVSAAMAAIECIHTYSLVHDDLPAMDNDEYRRGRLTTWKVYGDAIGILAGDGLLNYAFEILNSAAVNEFEKSDIVMAERLVRASAVLSKKAGSFGMIGGQTADLLAEGKGAAVNIDELLFIHKHKTACLIEAALMMGAILGGAGESDIKAIEQCGYNIGIAFQIQDDILDIIGNTEELGKKVGSDAANDKVTYVTLKGLEQSQKDVEKLSNEAAEILGKIDGDHDFLDALVMSLVNRRK